MKAPEWQQAWKLEPEVEFCCQRVFFLNSVFGAYLCHRSRYLHQIWCVHRKWGPTMCRVVQIHFPRKSKVADGSHLELVKSLILCRWLSSLAKILHGDTYEGPWRTAWVNLETGSRISPLGGVLLYSVLGSYLRRQSRYLHQIWCVHRLLCLATCGMVQICFFQKSKWQTAAKSNKLNRYNLAADCQISFKFCTITDMRVPWTTLIWVNTRDKSPPNTLYNSLPFRIQAPPCSNVPHFSACSCTYAPLSPSLSLWNPLLARRALTLHGLIW